MKKENQNDPVDFKSSPENSGNRVRKSAHEFADLISEFSRKLGWRPLPKGLPGWREIKRMSDISKLSPPFGSDRRSKRLRSRAVALVTVFCFFWTQVVWADGILMQEYEPNPNQPVVSLADEATTSALSGLPDDTTTAFFIGTESPLSAATPEENIETTAVTLSITPEPEGVIRDVYEGQSIQDVIDQCSVGDTVFVHAGTYHARLVLKEGVHLKGEDAATTIIHGDYAEGEAVIRAFGHNTIEGLTVTGAREVLGQSAAAILVEGNDVKIRSNRIMENLGAGVQVSQEAGSLLIELNLFLNNTTSVTGVGVGMWSGLILLQGGKKNRFQISRVSRS